MKVTILKTTVSPVERKTPSLLRKGTVVDLADETAKKLIEDGKAAKFEPAKAEKPEAGKEAPKKGKKPEASKEDGSDQ